MVSRLKGKFPLPAEYAWGFSDQLFYMTQDREAEDRFLDC